MINLTYLSKGLIYYMERANFIMKKKKIFLNHTVTKGFTLMEMLIVVTIIGILAAIVLPRFMASTENAKQKAHKAERQAINTQLELYYFNTDEHPSAMTDDGWTSFANYFPDGVPVSCNQDSPWVIDGTTHRIVLHSTHE